MNNNSCESFPMSSSLVSLLDESVMFYGAKTTEHTIVSTISNNRLYVGLGITCIGDINSYNNIITRLFAKIFGRSMEVDFGDGRSRDVQHVDKEDYRRFVLEVFNVEVDVDKISKYKEALRVDKVVSAKITGRYMRNMINRKDRNRKTHELEEALRDEDALRAEALIRTGAAVHEYFFSRPRNLGIRYCSYNADLPSGPHQFYVTHGPPVVHAQLADSERIFKLLKEFGAKTKHVEGERFLFVREREEASDNGSMNGDANVENGMPGAKFSALHGWSRRYKDRKEKRYDCSFDAQSRFVKARDIPPVSEENAKVVGEGEKG